MRLEDPRARLDGLADGEGPYAELPQQRSSFRLLLPVGDRPLQAAGQRSERVEVLPDLAQDPLGHEVRMHVDQPGKPQPPPEAAHLAGFLARRHVAHGRLIAHAPHDRL
jgi:hypothetical protein